MFEVLHAQKLNLHLDCVPGVRNDGMDCWHNVRNIECCGQDWLISLVLLLDVVISSNDDEIK